MYPFVDACFLGKPWEKVPDVALIDRLATQCAEQGNIPGEPSFRAKAKPLLNDGDRPSVDTHYSSLVAFAVLDNESSRLKIQVFSANREDFADA